MQERPRSCMIPGGHVLAGAPGCTDSVACADQSELISQCPARLTRYCILAQQYIVPTFVREGSALACADRLRIAKLPRGKR